MRLHISPTISMSLVRVWQRTLVARTRNGQVSSIIPMEQATTDWQALQALVLHSDQSLMDRCSISMTRRRRVGQTLPRYGVHIPTITRDSSRQDIHPPILLQLLAIATVVTCDSRSPIARMNGSSP